MITADTMLITADTIVITVDGWWPGLEIAAALTSIRIQPAGNNTVRFDNG